MPIRPFRKNTMVARRGWRLGLAFALASVTLSGCKGGASSSDTGDAQGKRAPSGEAGEKATGAEGDEAANPGAPAKDPAEVIAAHVEAVGGEKALAQVTSMHFVSDLDTGAQKITASSDHWWTADEGFFQQEEIPGFGVAKLGYDGETVWSVDPINGRRVLEGLERKQALWLADPLHWWRWEQYHPVATYEGEVEGEDGRTYDRVELRAGPDGEPGDEVVAEFDTESHLLARLKYTQVAPTGNVPLSFTFAEYESYGPIKIAQRQTAKLPVGEMSQVYADIEINPQVDTSQFAMPGADAAVPAPSEAADGTSGGGAGTGG